MTKVQKEAVNKLLDAAQNVLENSSGPDCTEHSLIRTYFLVQLEKAMLSMRGEK